MLPSSFCFTKLEKDQAVFYCIYTFFLSMTTFSFALDYFAMISAYCERRRLRFDFLAFFSTSQSDTLFYFFFIFFPASGIFFSFYYSSF